MKEEIAAYLAKKDYYDILSISKTATEAEIKKAYRVLALRFHPDKNQVPGSSSLNIGAKDAFNHISHAYTILIDPEKRQHYDRFGPETEQPRPQNRYRNAQQDYEFE
jgi:DnaJ-class molecular chaperone